MSFFSSVVGFVIYFVLPAAVVGYLWLRKKFSFWKDRNVPGPEPTWKYLAGNMTGMGSEVSFPMKMNEFYNEFKGETPAVGFYMSVAPNLLIIDPELAKTILIRDFSIFHDHGMYYNERDDPLSAHIFNIEGAKWKLFRNKLSPTFTSGKLKMMFSSIEQIGDRFVEVLDKHARDQSAFDVKNVSMRFTSDVVGSTAFGLDINTLSDPEHELFKAANKLMMAFNASSPGMVFKQTFKNLSRRLRLPLHPPEAAGFFMKIIKDTVAYREENNVNRSDFLQLLLQLKNRGYLDGETGEKEIEKMTFNEIAAQAFVFFFAGFETSSTAMNLTLYQLAKNENIQEKARREILEKIEKHGGKLSYEALMEMDYLGQVFNESMRLHPPVFLLMRKANDDYIIPDTQMKIDKGTTVFISNYSFHMDPEYFPEPEKFDPERFTKEKIDSRHPFTFLPFGEGPRICIGNRFAQLQSRFAIALLLRNFRVKLNERTEEPLKFDINYPGWSVINGIWLDCERV